MATIEAEELPRLNRSILQDLAQARLEDARALLRIGRHAGAYYLAGYAIECGLKACIAKQTKEGDFPPGRRTIEKYYSHNLRQLCKEAGIHFENKSEDDDRIPVNWNVIWPWSEQSRYDPEPLKSEKAYSDYFQAINEVFQWLQGLW